MSSDQIIIFDTTLRDGEQSPGCSMNTREKLDVANALVQLGVDVMEAGFPIASPGDFEAVKLIAERFGDQTTVCALARSRDEDIAKAKAALADAKNSRIHVFLATSAIHREHKLKMDKNQIIERAVSSVKDAKEFTDDVEFSPEDAARTELDFLCEVVEKTIAAGATTVNIPDTVGYATPNHYFKVIRTLKEQVPNIDQAIISTHCHNDLGLAVANSLSAVEAGARQIECTINGLGERAGNAALEEVVMALRTRADYYKVQTNIRTERLFPTSQLVSSITGMKVQRNKAIVGQNAFAHEAGIHQHGILQERTTYEIMRPADVGYTGQNLVLGKHSGRHAFKDRVAELGFNLSKEDLQIAFESFIALADKKKEVYDSDIIALIDSRSDDVSARWKLISFHTSAGSRSIPTATLELQCDGKDVTCDAAIGDGPIDAVFRALERVIDLEARLEEFHVSSVSEGKDALGEVRVTINYLGRHYLGKGVSTDIIEAAAVAYLQALNKADSDRQSGTSEAEKVSAHSP